VNRDSYKTIAMAASIEIIEKKSRFIGYTAPITGEEDATEFIAKIKEKHRDATHNVYAYQAGEHNQVQRSNDDGEPSGTAGRPILEIIKKLELQNTAVVVTRYFGGILLGTGGLIRAYGRAASLVLAEACTVIRCPAITFSISFEYALLAQVQNLLVALGGIVKNTFYADNINIICLIKETKRVDFLQKIADLGQGTINTMLISESDWLDEPLKLG